MKIKVTIFIISLLYIWTVPKLLASAPEPPCSGNEGRVIHIVVIDCTTSMKDKLSEKLQALTGLVSKWEWVASECRRIVETAPEQCEIIFMPFGNNYNGKIGLPKLMMEEQNIFLMSDPGQRDKAKAFIEKLKPVEKQTAYFLARRIGVDLAIERSKREAVPTFLTVLTDGDDSGSPLTYNEIFLANEITFQNEIFTFKNLNPNNRIRLPKLGVVAADYENDAERPSVIITPNLPKQGLSPMQKEGVKLELCVSKAPFSPPLPKDAVMEIKVIGAPGLTVDPSIIQLPSNGGSVQTRLFLNPFNQILADNGITATLHLTYEPSNQLSGEPTQIQVVFPPISQVRCGKILPNFKNIALGKSQSFRLDNSKGCNIRWDIQPPSGEKRTSKEGDIKFDQEGIWTIKAIASKGDLKPFESEPIDIQAVDNQLQLSSDPNTPLVQGRQVRLICKAPITVKALSWQANGQTPDAGSAQSMGNGIWHALFTFKSGGNKLIQVKGTDQFDTAGIEKDLAVLILDQPSIEIVSPVNETFDAGLGPEVEVIAQSIGALGIPTVRIFAKRGNDSEIELTSPKDPFQLEVDRGAGGIARGKKSLNFMQFAPTTPTEKITLVARIEVPEQLVKQGVSASESPTITNTLLRPGLQIHSLKPSSLNPSVPLSNFGDFRETFQVSLSGSLLRSVASLRFTSTVNDKPDPELSPFMVPVTPPQMPPFECVPQGWDGRFPRNWEGKQVRIVVEALKADGKPVQECTPVEWKPEFVSPPPNYRLDVLPNNAVRINQPITVALSGWEIGDVITYESDPSRIANVNVGNTPPDPSKTEFIYTQPCTTRISASIKHGGKIFSVRSEPIQITSRQPTGSFTSKPSVVYAGLENAPLGIQLDIGDGEDPRCVISCGGIDEIIPLKPKQDQIIWHPSETQRGKVYLKLVAKAPQINGNKEEIELAQTEFKSLVRPLGQITHNFPNIIRPFGEETISLKDIKCDCSTGHFFFWREVWLDQNRSLPTSAEIQSSSKNGTLNEIMAQYGFNLAESEIKLNESRLGTLDSGEIQMIMVFEGPALENDPIENKQYKQDRFLILQKPLGLKQPGFWLGVGGIISLAVLMTILMRKNDPVSWDFTADIAWGEKLPIQNPCTHEWPFIIGMGRGLARRSNHWNSSDDIPIPNKMDIFKGWLRGSWINKEMSCDLSELLRAIGRATIHKLSKEEDQLAFQNEIDDLSIKYSSSKLTLGLYLTQPWQNDVFSSPSWSIRNANDLGDIEPAAGADNPESPEQIRQIVFRQFNPQTVLYLRTVASKGTLSYIFFGLMNKAVWVLGAGAIAFVCLWMSQYGVPPF